MVKILFILKRREDYSSLIHTTRTLASGLANSVMFLSEMLDSQGINNKIAIVHDNNDIDREVYQYKPTHVIIEALWVVPSKFNILTKLHPKVQWFIRLHSELPFIANEGVAMGWLLDYVGFKHVHLAVNSQRMQRDMVDYISNATSMSRSQAKTKVVFLPNYYPDSQNKAKQMPDDLINVSCFGAIRPMKNQLIQAQAALEFANRRNLRLRFHINAGRVEQKGEPVLNNLKGMFAHAYDRGHELVCHEWLDRIKFLTLCAEMDIGMQVSLNETFNIVAADHITMGVPLVASREIPWPNPVFCAKPTDLGSIVNKLELTYCFSRFNTWSNQLLLRHYCHKAKQSWSSYFKG